VVGGGGSLGRAQRGNWHADLVFPPANARSGPRGSAGRADLNGVGRRQCEQPGEGSKTSSGAARKSGHQGEPEVKVRGTSVTYHRGKRVECAVGFRYQNWRPRRRSPSPSCCVRTVESTKSSATRPVTGRTGYADLVSVARKTGRLTGHGLGLASNSVGGSGLVQTGLSTVEPRRAGDPSAGR